MERSEISKKKGQPPERKGTLAMPDLRLVVRSRAGPCLHRRPWGLKVAEWV